MLDAELPKGKIIGYESPDFLYFTSKMKAIGIEITRLMFHKQNLSFNTDEKRKLRGI